MISGNLTTLEWEVGLEISIPGALCGDKICAWSFWDEIKKNRRKKMGFVLVSRENQLAWRNFKYQNYMINSLIQNVFISIVFHSFFLLLLLISLSNNIIKYYYHHHNCNHYFSFRFEIHVRVCINFSVRVVLSSQANFHQINTPPPPKNGFLH